MKEPERSPTSPKNKNEEILQGNKLKAHIKQILIDKPKQPI